MLLMRDERLLLIIDIVLDLGIHARPNPIQKKDIATRVDVTVRQLDRIIQNLITADLVKASRGPKGGYVLAHERRKITLFDLLMVANLPNDAKTLDDNNKVSNGIYRSVISMPLLNELNSEIEEKLRGITVQNLIDRMAKHKSENTKNIDFAI